MEKILTIRLNSHAHSVNIEERFMYFKKQLPLLLNVSSDSKPTHRKTNKRNEIISSFDQESSQSCGNRQRQSQQSSSPSSSLPSSSPSPSLSTESRWAPNKLSNERKFSEKYKPYFVFDFLVNTATRHQKQNCKRMHRSNLCSFCDKYLILSFELFRFVFFFLVLIFSSLTTTKQ